MKTLLVVTYVDFWEKGSGHRSRINSIMNYFKSKIRITVFFAGAINDNETISFNTIFPEIDLICPAHGYDAALTFQECGEKFRYFISDKFFDIALIEYIELSIVLQYLPGSTITVLDTHDIVYNRIESFKKMNVEYDGIVLSKEEELTIFNCYDYIILIQKRDYEDIATEMDYSPLLLVPHPVNLKKKRVRRKVENVGYVASPYSPNIDALKWFINNVWDNIFQKHHLVLNVFGNIRLGYSEFLNMDSHNIIFHGFVEELEDVYKLSDIIINPIRCGAGLKIKNVEALGYGIPLITSSHGAIGIEDSASKAFLIADSAEDYSLAFDLIVNNYDLRKEISDNAFKYARLNFSAEKCYGSLSKIFNK